MAILSFVEILDVIIISACIGYIFSRFFARFNPNHQWQNGRRFNWSDFLFSIYIVVPAIVLHELGHKLVAMAFGYDATFFSALSINKLIHGMPFFDLPAILMIIALVTTYFGSSFLFFIPAYVAFTATPPALQTALIAFAGPAVNMILWLGSAWLIRSGRVSKKYYVYTVITSKINKLLFIFNMIPFPGFDGFQVLVGLLKGFGVF